MRDLGKGLDRLAAHALCRRIARDELRKLRLKINKFPIEPVVFAVADYRRGFLVIEPVVLFDFAAQLGDSFCRLRFFPTHAARYKRAKHRQSQRIER